MTYLKLSTLTAILLSLVACSSSPAPAPTPTSTPPPPTGDPPPSPQAGDTTAPSIVSVTPNNSAVGVEKDVKIRIEFSEAMNRQATELAYQSADIPAVTFTWSKGDTRLEISPATPLDCTPTGKLYTFKLKSTATDLAGNALAAFTSSFTTFKELTKTLTGVAALDGIVVADGSLDTTDLSMIVGDDKNNLQIKAFLSFDLGGLETAGQLYRRTSLRPPYVCSSRLSQAYPTTISFCQKRICSRHMLITVRFSTRTTSTRQSYMTWAISRQIPPSSTRPTQTL